MAENGQFNGNGVSFTNFTLTQSATLSTGVGTFSGKQTPRNAKGKTESSITTATQTVELTGDFVRTTGCHHNIHAVFVRRAGT